VTGDGPTVHFVPDYTDENPYQDLLADALRRDGVTVRVRESGGGPLPLLRGALKPEIPDIVHVHFLHQFLTPADVKWSRLIGLVMALRTLFELVVLRLLGVSIVWTAHDLLDHERRTVGIERLTKHVFVRLLVSDVIVHCEAAKDLVVDCYRLPTRLTETMTVVPHGTFGGDYPDRVSKRTARERLDLPGETFVFAFFGTIKPYKNVTTLVETFAKLDGGPHLLIAGNPETPALEREVTDAASGLDRVRTTLEFVPDDDVQLYMRAADVVVLPFRTDDRSVLTSGSVLLAMSFGRPVVAPDLGCISAYLGSGGFVYEPHATAGLEAAMRSAMEADVSARGACAARRAEALDWDSVATRTRAVYEHREPDSTETSLTRDYPRTTER
jgi:glycosyltransferase involved in cell wall biosynthesis